MAEAMRAVRAWSRDQATARDKDAMKPDSVDDKPDVNNPRHDDPDASDN